MGNNIVLKKKKKSSHHQETRSWLDYAEVALNCSHHGNWTCAGEDQEELLQHNRCKQNVEGENNFQQDHHHFIQMHKNV